MGSTKLRLWHVAAATTAIVALATAGLTLAGPGDPAAAADGVTAAATAGCGRTPTLTTGTHTIQSSGQSRSYILNVPANYDRNHPYRLVFGLHWLGGTATDVATGQTVQRDVWAYYGLLRLSNNSTIFVAPQGLNNGWANSNDQDLTLIDNIISQIEGDLCVDTSQLFSIGFSYGAAMTYAIACARANVFRAVAVQSGGLLSGCTGGTQPIAYLGVHGISDGVLSISGGRSLRDRFVRNNGCAAANPPEPAAGSHTHTVFDYSGCSAGHPVEWAAFDEGHIAAPHDGGNGDSGSTWVPGVVWKFFTQFQSTNPTPTPTTPTTPPTTPVTTPPTTPVTTPPVTGACSASYRTTGSWPGGFQGEVTVTAGSAPISGWTVKWTLGSGQTVTQVWNGTLSTNGSNVTVTNASYNGSLQASGSTTFGLLGNGSPSTPTLTCSSR